MATYDRRVMYGKEAERATYRYASHRVFNEASKLAVMNGEAHLGSGDEGSHGFTSWSDLTSQYADAFPNAVWLSWAAIAADGSTVADSEWPNTLEAGERFTVEISPDTTENKLTMYFQADANAMKDLYFIDNLRPTPIWKLADLQSGHSPPTIISGNPVGPEGRDWADETSTVSQGDIAIVSGAPDNPVFSGWARLIDQRQDESLQLSGAGIVSALNLVEALTWVVRYEERINLFSTITWEGNEYDIYSVRPVGRQREMELSCRRTIPIL